MPIAAIIAQPAADSLNAAYRPVILQVRASATNALPVPPVVYCDIYLNGIFYKTISKTQYIHNNGPDSNWEFDIQDAAQEFLKKYLAPNGGSLILLAQPVLVKAKCKFRSSGLDLNGFIQPEGTAPVQGTGSTLPTPGDGTASNDFFIINAALQHDSNQDLATHLSAFKNRVWSVNAFPLTHRPDHYKLCSADSDYFPIVYNGSNEFVKLVLNYRFRGQSKWRTLEKSNVCQCPIFVNRNVLVVNNGDTTQTITFTWDAFSTIVTGVTIGHRIQGTAGAFTNVDYPAGGPAAITLPLGIYEFQFTSHGNCVDTSETVSNIGVPTTPCIAVGIVGTPDLPDAVVATPYNYSFTLSGTAPMVIDNVIKPAWMNINVVGLFPSGTAIQFTGTPATGDIAAAVPVHFDILNCFGADSVHFADALNVAAAANNTISVRIAPGVMDLFSPQNCYQWEGTVSIIDSLLVVLATHTWSAHTSPDEVEGLVATGLPDGNFTVEWNLVCRQVCNLVADSVRYIKDGAPAEIRAQIDSKTFAIAGNSTALIELYVDKT